MEGIDRKTIHRRNMLRGPSVRCTNKMEREKINKENVFFLNIGGSKGQGSVTSQLVSSS